MKAAKWILIWVWIGLACLADACGPSVPTSQPDPTASKIPLTSTAGKHTHTPTPSPTFTPTPELLSCGTSLPPVEATRPVEIIYSNQDQVWLWSETPAKNTQIQLPADAAAPRLSPDGRFIAYLKQDQSYDSLERTVQEIPLWLFDRQTGQSRQVASFQTDSTRKLFPEAPQILLKMEWLPGGHWLLAQLYPVPWSDGVLQPTGDLFLINADTGASQRILAGGNYEYYSLRPDGSQIAALDTAYISEFGTWNPEAMRDGKLYLIDIPPLNDPIILPVRHPNNAWALSAPDYSADGSQIAFQIEAGLAVVDSQTGSIQTVTLANPCEKNNCYWGGLLPIVWLPDSQAFYTMTSINDHFDLRSETTLYLIRVEPEIKTEEVKVIHANPYTIQFSPDRQILSFWNQPDVDNGEKNLNWVTLYLVDLQAFQPKRYVAEFVLRVNSWRSDNQGFLYTYSPFGGANPVYKRFALGNICQPARELPVPEGQLIEQTQWLDNNRFLAWTVPADGIPDLYNAGLYLYTLTGAEEPVHIVDLVREYSKPYGMGSQVIVLEK
jgi:hypothetical protein